MATSGRPGSAVGVRAALAALTGAAVLLAGCASPAGAPTPVSASASGPSTSAASGPAASASSSATTEPAPDAPEPTVSPCRVDLPARWSTALHDGVVPPQGGELLTVALGTADGSVLAVSDVAKKRHALVWRRGDAETVVQDFGLDHPEWQVLAATYDGRYVAYRVDRSYSSFEDFALYVWDSQATRRPVEVAHGERDAHGELMQTPFVDPVLADGWLYWTQTRDQDPGHTVLSGYRLRDGHVERLSRGYGRAPVRFGDALVWADSAGPAETSRLRMIDLATHRPVPVPAPLQDVRGPYYLAGDARTLAWVGGAKGQQLWVWRTGWSAPHLLVGDVKSPQLPAVADDVVVLTGEDAVYAADLRSWSHARVTPRYGGIDADVGPVVVVGYAPTSEDGASVQALLDTADAGPLGRGGC